MENKVVNRLNDFLQDNKQFEMFGMIDASDIPNYFRIVKYSKDNNLYIDAYYGNKKLVIFKKTNEAKNEFIKFIYEFNK